MPKDIKHYYGYKLSRGQRSCTVWVFQKGTHKLVGTLKRSCNPELSGEARIREQADFLKHFGITIK